MALLVLLLCEAALVNSSWLAGGGSPMLGKLCFCLNCSLNLVCYSSALIHVMDRHFMRMNVRRHCIPSQAFGKKHMKPSHSKAICINTLKATLRLHSIRYILTIVSKITGNRATISMDLSKRATDI